MQHRLISLFAAVLSLLAISCRQEEPDQPTPTPGPTPSAYNYNIMFWGHPGGNDGITLADFTSLIIKREKDSISTKVRFHGCYKPSPEFLEGLAGTGMDCTFYFDLGEKRNLSDQDLDKIKQAVSAIMVIDSVNVPLTVAAYKAVFGQMSIEKYGTSSLPMNDPDTIAAFISKLSAKYTAAHNELMLFGHGDGFQPGKDAPVKGCVIDHTRQSAAISADQLVEGVRRSGVKVQSLFTQCCLMSTLENLSAYAKVFDYAFAAAEITTGGYFYMYPVRLSETGNSEIESMKTACKKVVDDYIASPFLTQDEYATTHGFYDLTSFSTILGAVKDISSWYADNYSKDSVFFNNEIHKTVIVSDLYARSREYKAYLGQILSGNYTALKDSMTQSFMSNIYSNAIYMNQDSGNEQGIVFAHLVQNTLDHKDSTKVATIDFNKLSGYYNSYMSELKSKAYIRATQTAGAKQTAEYIAYVLDSPSVNLFAMNSGSYKPMQIEENPVMADSLWNLWSSSKYEEVRNCFLAITDGCYHATELKHQTGDIKKPAYSLTTVQSNLKASVFDIATGWSTFLEKINVNPNIAINPSRIEVSGFTPKAQ